MGKNTNTKELKLYVWEGVLTDYSSGVMFALAHSTKEAREVILKKETDSSGYVGTYLKNDLKGRPQIVSKPEGFTCWGGG